MPRPRDHGRTMSPFLHPPADQMLTEPNLDHGRNPALCANMVTPTYDPWFSDDPREQRDATRICMQCPLQNTCATHALVNDFEYGIFGGLTPHERKPIRRKMLRTLSKDALQKLKDRYYLPDILPPEQVLASVVALHQRRQQRAEFCYEKLVDMPPESLPRYDMWMECLKAVLANPMWSGDRLAPTMGLARSAFNRNLRDCFKFFDVDLSVR